MARKMASQVPTAKVIATTTAALLTPIVLGLLKMKYPDLPLPADADNLTKSLVEGLVSGLIALGAGWATPPAARDTIEAAPPKE